MEDISPSLALVLEIRAALEGGQSVRQGLNQYLNTNCSDLSDKLKMWIIRRDHQQEIYSLVESLSPTRRVLLQCLDRGLSGSPILPQLMELEKEIVNLCEAEIEEQVRLMPVKMLLPLLGLMFPAYLVLLFGPFIESLAKLGQ